MTGLVEGLGNNEYSDTTGFGDTGSKVAAVWVTGSIVTQSNLQVAGTGSITGALRSASVTDDIGTVRSVTVENATALGGYKVKAGSVAFGDGVSGLVAFKENFANAHYFLTCSARTFGIPWASTGVASGIPFGASGTRRASGCWLYGGSGAVVDWIAVGL